MTLLPCIELRLISIKLKDPDEAANSVSSVLC